MNITSSDFIGFGKVSALIILIVLVIVFFGVVRTFFCKLARTISLMRFIYCSSHSKATGKSYFKGWFQLFYQSWKISSCKITRLNSSGKWLGVGNWEYYKDGKQHKGNKKTD